ncbi:hypothetical protein EDB86DRAFT_2833464 [Lactarius hatsudake]|nr:hypothetical protein EDB86DRAFT_2833464 [Lactarius hatsudake]
MQSGARVSDDLMSRGRFLRQLDLVPANRPLFTCERCGFSNVYIPLCLWCTWTSPDATSAFKAATPRRSRRISSPSNPSKAARKADACSLRREDRQIQAPPMTPSGPKASFRPSVTTDALENPAKPAPAAKPDVQSDQNRVVRATGGALRSSDADHPRKPSALRIRRGLPAVTVVVPTRYPIMTTTIVSPGSPHTAPVSGDVKHATHPFSLPSLLTPPTRTLRRKHHMTFPDEKSKRSLRSRVLDVPPPLPTPVSPSTVLYGHSSSPQQWGKCFASRYTTTPSSAPSPVTPAEKGQSLSSSPQGRPSFEFTRPRRSTTSGWSLSGEIELRIALSQRREGEDGVAPRGSEKRGSIVRGVRKLGAGLRNLVLRRN